ncbi:coniferyl aldehyde dehydrogenase [Tropicibacter sp. Alg240-R139]|uniref:coniferyl aldehyde dehydrogenase n=1 Tax=Tropicibacter sp. Alg240-R139 TaxID=2305991 RepID=UPI001F083A56|nr:coniferyl aldehyde dehydrogenase [Tropicibacter sp. Alg240-R139]
MTPLDVAGRLAEMRDAYQADPNPDYKTRKDRLVRLEKGLLAYEDRLIAAMQTDFSHRSAIECKNYDLTASIAEIRSARRHLRKWMRPRRYGMPLYLLPARGRVHPQPLGVVGILAPWNFPVYLVISPLVPALAAGNRVIVKPSEITPHTSDVLQKMFAEFFSPLEITTVLGGPEAAAGVTQLPLDHLLFTGSTPVGRIIAEQAAKNLTPVTLELGGKSPTIVGKHGNIERAARRVAYGKCMNAGQICVSPDYALVPREKMNEFTAAVERWMHKFYGEFVGNPDYSAIVSDKHRTRIRELVEEAESAGTKTVRLERATDDENRVEPPVLLVDPSQDLRVMQEEIFGPILPVIPYDTAEDALRYVSERDRPLALYVFSEDRKEKAFWTEKSISGGLLLNDTVMHVAADTLPFGGVGASGIGAYHGVTGFERFSHMKPVMTQARLNGAFLFEPPMKGLRAKGADLYRKIV